MSRTIVEIEQAIQEKKDAGYRICIGCRNFIEDNGECRASALVGLKVDLWRVCEQYKPKSRAQAW